MQVNYIFPMLFRIIMQNNLKQPEKNLSVTKSESELKNNMNVVKTNPPQKLLQSLPAAQQRNPEPQTEMILLPVPLKSEIFPNSKFFTKIKGQSDYNVDENTEQHNLAFYLNTIMLGELYFIVVQQENNLFVNCAASRIETVHVINSSFQELAKILTSMGWKHVHCSCIQLENPAAELILTTPPGFLDTKI